MIVGARAGADLADAFVAALADAAAGAAADIADAATDIAAAFVVAAAAAAACPWEGSSHTHYKKTCGCLDFARRPLPFVKSILTLTLTFGVAAPAA